MSRTRADMFTDELILLQDYIIIRDRLLEHPRKLDQFLDHMGQVFHLLNPDEEFTFEHEPPHALIEETKKVWGKRLKRILSDSEAIEIIRSFSDFFVLLKEIKANAK